MKKDAVISRRAVLLGSATLATFGSATGSSFAAKTSIASLDAGLFSILKLMPESSVYAGLTQAQVGAPIFDRFDDYSPEGEARNRAALTRALASARAAGSGNAAAIAQATYKNALRIQDVDYGRILPLSFLGHTPFVVSQIGGAAIDPLNLMAAQQPVTNSAQAKDYVLKILDFTRMFDGTIEKIRADAALGLNLPLALMKKTLTYLDEAIKTSAASHEIVTTLRGKLKTAGLSDTQIAEVQLSATQKLEENLYPSLIKLRGTLQSFAPKAQVQDGFWAQPQGERFYANAVRTLGDTTRTPAQVYQLGLDEVARITAEMDTGLRKLGYTSGSVGTRMKALAAEPKNMYADSDDGRAALLENLRAQVSAVNLKMPLFLNKNTIPPQQVEVRRVPIATENSAPGGYYDSPSLDGTRPGIYWINLRDMKAVSKLRLATLTFHEAVPGHHLANAIALNQPNQPLVQKLASFNGFNEGWALYAERLAFELGFYESDPTGNLGRLQDELFRAVRLVVDSGLHFKRWDREKAIAYAMAATGNVRSRMEAEIERYMAWPGQALGYKLGMIELLSQRDQMKKRQGNRFSLNNFHDGVLINGSRPLSLVARDIAKI